MAQIVAYRRWAKRSWVNDDRCLKATSATISDENPKQEITFEIDWAGKLSANKQDISPD
jgi:hypothetical protein